VISPLITATTETFTKSFAQWYTHWHNWYTWRQFMRCTQLDWTSDASAVIKSVAHSVCSVDIPEHSAIGSVLALPTCNAVGSDITGMHDSAAWLWHIHNNAHNGYTRSARMCTVASTDITSSETSTYESDLCTSCTGYVGMDIAYTYANTMLWAVCAVQYYKQYSTKSHSERKVVYLVSMQHHNNRFNLW
jgi:Na+-translocating ferredoxin:NAD+ oxidoreductase RNF subunit RnfB